ncbi:polysaccharide pyruvyl transferase family protein [Streptomyces sp. ISL-90]|nr:polysaccharide pyruvyl transferase family protein [Streptomyces sp. ISL-90]
MAALATSAWGDETEVSFQDFSQGDSPISFSGRTVLRDAGRRRGPIKMRLSEFDLVLDSGAGDSFADIYGVKRLAIMNYAHRMASRKSVPLVLGPQTIGPFQTKIGSAIGRDSLRRARGVFPRDSESGAFARRLGSDGLNLSTDVVFALPQPTSLSRQRDIILNISGLLWNGSGHVDPTKYRSEVISLARGLRERGRTVSLLAHVVDNPGPDNDVQAIREVASILGDNVETIVPDSLESTRSAIASSKLMIGSRMHACLNALSTGVPAVPWAYSRKFAPLMADLGWDVALDLRSHPSPAQATLEIVDSDSHGSVELIREVRNTARERLDSTIAKLTSLAPQAPTSEHSRARGGTE